MLGVAAQTGEPLATTLVSRLKAKQLLVIIDNCEHVLGPVARFVDRLAASAPEVRVLATSREPLGIAAERVRAVPPLAEGTAVELFIDRATQAGAVLDDSQRRAISEICVRLDGIAVGDRVGRGAGADDDAVADRGAARSTLPAVDRRGPHCGGASPHVAGHGVVVL